MIFMCLTNVGLIIIFKEHICQTQEYRVAFVCFPVGTGFKSLPRCCIFTLNYLLNGILLLLSMQLHITILTDARAAPRDPLVWCLVCECCVL